MPPPPYHVEPLILARVQQGCRACSLNTQGVEGIHMQGRCALFTRRNVVCELPCRDAVVCYPHAGMLCVIHMQGRQAQHHQIDMRRRERKCICTTTRPRSRVRVTGEARAGLQTANAHRRDHMPACKLALGQRGSEMARGKRTGLGHLLDMNGDVEEVKDIVHDPRGPNQALHSALFTLRPFTTSNLQMEAAACTTLALGQGGKATSVTSFPIASHQEFLSASQHPQGAPHCVFEAPHCKEDLGVPPAVPRSFADNWLPKGDYSKSPGSFAECH